MKQNFILTRDQDVIKKMSNFSLSSHGGIHIFKGTKTKFSEQKRKGQWRESASILPGIERHHHWKSVNEK